MAFLRPPFFVFIAFFFSPFKTALLFVWNRFGKGQFGYTGCFKVGANFYSVRIIICIVAFIYSSFFIVSRSLLPLFSPLPFFLFLSTRVYAFVKNVTRNDQFILNFLFPATYSVYTYIYSFSKSKIKEIVARW